MVFLRRSPEKNKIQVVVDRASSSPPRNTANDESNKGRGHVGGQGRDDHDHDHSKIRAMRFVRRKDFLWMRGSLALAAFVSVTTLLVTLLHQPWDLSSQEQQGGGDGPWWWQQQQQQQQQQRSSVAELLNGQVPRYHELADEIRSVVQRGRLDDIPHRSAFVKATTIQRADPWFKPKKICRRNCCAETVAISLHQDDHHIVNTVGGWDLADTLVKHYPDQPWHDNIQVFAEPSLNEDLLPCLQPGTIIHLDNHAKILHYFWLRLRPNITVPYVLVSGESDGDNPDDYFSNHAHNLGTDSLLIKWYGINPDLTVPAKYNGTDKFEPFPLGLSKHHPQSPRLSAYLELTGFANPFLDKTRWTSRFGNKGAGAGAGAGDSSSLRKTKTGGDAENVDKVFSESFFVMFAVHEHSKHRQPLFDGLCQNLNPNADKNNADSVSCIYATDGQKVTPHELYGAASKYLFGVSPPGYGWDCYRTYELLLLGVIPIIQERPGSRELFRDLPVIHVPYLTDFHYNGVAKASPHSKNWTRTELVQMARDYVQSDEFQQSNFTGWDRLFMRYWRRKMLKETGRDKKILQDEHGREYYQAWRYTRVGAGDENKPLYCNDKGKCTSSAYQD